MTAGMIHFGIDTQNFVGDVKPATAPLAQFLIVAQLNAKSGALTAVQAFKEFRDAGGKGNLGIYGQGDSQYIAEIRSYVATRQLAVESLTVSTWPILVAAPPRQASVSSSLWLSTLDPRLSTCPFGYPLFAAGYSP